jgi:hypothetical protein
LNASAEDIDTYIVNDLIAAEILEPIDPANPARRFSDCIVARKYAGRLINQKKKEKN